MTRIQQIDDWFDARLEPARHIAAVQGLFSLLSRAGEFSLIWHAVIWVRAIGSTSRAGEALVFSLLLGAESLVVNQGLKRVFRRSRPNASGDDRFSVRTPVTSSFPSGHSSSAFFAATVLVGLTPGAWTVAFFVLAAGVALSRVMVRLHHFSDILGGALVGAALGLLAAPLVG
jgi:undecaprenyl-diphosphatase